MEESDSQARAAYEYRALLLQVSEGLTQNDCEKIVFLEELPRELLHELPYDLEHKTPLNVLAQLEMHGKLSASRLDDLVKLLKTIARYDLAKKVHKFIKQQQKQRVVLSPLQRLDHLAEKHNSSLEMILLQCKILLEQIENMKEETEEACYKRVEEVVAGAQAVVSKYFQRKFLYASKLTSQEVECCEQTVCSNRDQNYEFVVVITAQASPSEYTSTTTLISDRQYQCYNRVSRTLQPCHMTWLEGIFN